MAGFGGPYDDRVNSRILAVVGVGAVLFSLSACNGDDKKAAAEDTPIPAASAAGDIADLQDRWWTWAASQPAATNPVTDTTGEDCAQGQPADVFFVAGTLGGDVKRTCAVPAGKPIAGPLLSFKATAQECEAAMAAADGEVVLDGSPVDVKKLAPEQISIKGVPENPVTRVGTEVHTTACGLWFTLAPLAPGEHKLAFHGVSDTFSVGVEYTLNVA